MKVPPLEPVTAAPTPAALLLTSETISLSPSGSVSLASTPLPAVKWSVVSSLVAPESLTAVGPSLVPVIVTTTVAVEVAPLGSVMV
ncbi:hypothetical protein D3C85_893420 [compost metagenome]